MAERNRTTRSGSPNHETDELGPLLERITLSEDEKSEISLENSWNSWLIESESLCLVGKIHTHKRVNLTGLQNAITSTWKTSSSVQVKDLGKKIFLFQFSNSYDVNRILQKSPWNFDRSLIILNRFNKSFAPKNYDFSTNPFWVQIFGLPYGLHGADAGHQIGNSMGKVLEVDDSFTRALRVRIQLGVNNPLRRFRNVKISATKTVKVRMKYERLPEFCFICGCMGHVVSDCGIGFRLKEAGEKVPHPYGIWLRAENDYWGPETFEELVVSDSKILPKVGLPNNSAQKSTSPLEGESSTRNQNHIGNQNQPANIQKNSASKRMEGLDNSSDQQEATSIMGDLPLSHLVKSTKRKEKNLRKTWKRCDRNSVQPTPIMTEKQGKRKPVPASKEDSRASKVRLDVSGNAIVIQTEPFHPSTG